MKTIFSLWLSLFPYLLWSQATSPPLDNNCPDQILSTSQDSIIINNLKPYLLSLSTTQKQNLNLFLKYLNQPVSSVSQTTSSSNKSLKEPKKNTSIFLWISTIVVIVLQISILMKKSTPKTIKEETIEEPKPSKINKSTTTLPTIPLTTSINPLIVNSSVIGKSHLKASPPINCQDSNEVLMLEKGWGIAISCDGAGSAKLSDIGSKFVAQKAVNLFKAIIEKHNWIKEQQLPSQKRWETIGRDALLYLRAELELHAKNQKLNISDLACTIIVLIYSPIGILCTHIGDGRAGYKTKKGEWKACLTPHKGEEANQTIFLTSNSWLKGDFELSGLKVPESIVIKTPPVAFTLLSDGCESHCFKCGYFDKDQQKFISQNKPFSGFYNPAIQHLYTLRKEGLTSQELQEKWAEFLKNGTEGFAQEPDDKTLILGIL